MESLTVSLHEDTLAKVKALKKNPGDALNTILDDYINARGELNIKRIGDAVLAHVLTPSVSDVPVKRTTIYMVPTRMKALRAYAQKTHLTFDGVLRILVNDYLARQRETV